MSDPHSDAMSDSPVVMPNPASDAPVSGTKSLPGIKPGTKSSPLVSSDPLVAPIDAPQSGTQAITPRRKRGRPVGSPVSARQLAALHRNGKLSHEEAQLRKEAFLRVWPACYRIVC